jgi:hypothetical protein
MSIGANAEHADPYRPVAHSAIATPEAAKTSGNKNREALALCDARSH